MAALLSYLHIAERVQRNDERGGQRGERRQKSEHKVEAKDGRMRIKKTE